MIQTTAHSSTITIEQKIIEEIILSPMNVHAKRKPALNILHPKCHGKIEDRNKSKKNDEIFNTKWKCSRAFCYYRWRSNNKIPKILIMFRWYVWHNSGSIGEKMSESRHYSRSTQILCGMVKGRALTYTKDLCQISSENNTPKLFFHFFLFILFR